MHPIKTFLALAAVAFAAGCGGGGGGGDGGGAPAPSGSGPRPAAAVELVDGSTVGATQWPAGPTATGGRGQVVEGIGCGLTGSAYEAHAHLSIIQDGQQLAVPGNIGVVGEGGLRTPTGSLSGCKYAIHTNDASGKIHVTAATPSTYTLGQFFAIWGEPLSTTNVAGLNGPVTAYINDNGALTQYSGNLADIELANGRQITLVVGSTPNEIPTYVWTDPPKLAASATTLVGQQLGANQWAAGNTTAGGQGQTVQGVPCDVMSEAYHVHTHVSIFLNGQQLAVPNNIGIVPAGGGSTGCTYEIHTHDTSGKIHVEAPAPKDFTLGQLFAIWGQPLGFDNVAGLTGPIEVYVTDGNDVRRHTGNLADIKLVSHREITIQVGSRLTETPTYEWAGP
ncbi:MAG TPA: hypothetical protein VFS42_11825 [Burkholderiaceae bacterium]|nr:hypothetical protein [Burkholderiaceae bacterium]